MSTARALKKRMVFYGLLCLVAAAAMLMPVIYVVDDIVEGDVVLMDLLTVYMRDDKPSAAFVIATGAFAFSGVYLLFFAIFRGRLRRVLLVCIACALAYVGIRANVEYRRREEENRLGGMLHAAVRLGDVEAARGLLAKGAPVDSRIWYETTPLVRAACCHGSSWVSTFGKDAEALMYGVGRSVPKGPHTDMVKMLVENGADVNSRDAIGRTPLMVAAAQPEGVDLCRLLIEHGARIDAADAQGGHTVLHWAAVSSIHRGPLDTVMYLIDRGVDIDATNHTGKTALSYAVLWDDLDLADALLDLGADPNTGAWCERPIVISGGTLLYTSNPSGMIPPAGSDMVKLLAEYGATNVAEGLPAKE